MNIQVMWSALLISAIGIISYNIKSVISSIWSHFVNIFCFSIKVDESSDFFYFLQNFIISEKQDKIHNFYYRTFFDSFIDDAESDKKNLFYNYGYLWFKFNNHKVLLFKDNEKLTNSISPYKNTKQTIFIYSFNRLAISSLLNHVNEKYGNNKIRYYFNDSGEVKLLNEVRNKTFDNIFLNDNLSELIKIDLDLFIKSKEKYVNLGLKYKRVYLFHGEAGTGKSSLSVAMANHSKRNILSINMCKNLDDSMLISLIANRPENPIILFEDIDCLFENINRNLDPIKENEGNKITLSCLLNILDGCYTPNNTIFVITTNFIDKIDDAIKRDGRVNLNLEITKPNEETKIKYIEYLNNLNVNNINIEDFKDKTISSIEKDFLNK